MMREADELRAGVGVGEGPAFAGLENVGVIDLGFRIGLEHPRVQCLEGLLAINLVAQCTGGITTNFDDPVDVDGGSHGGLHLRDRTVDRIGHGVAAGLRRQCQVVGAGHEPHTHPG